MLPQESEKPKEGITHSHLIREMLVEARCRYNQLNPREFLGHLLEAIKGLKIDQSTLQKAADLGSEEECSSEIFYIKAYEKIRATTRIASDGRCLVLKGSRAKSKWSASFSYGYRSKSQQLLERGVLIREEDHTDDFKFVEGYEFQSVSQGVSIVQGTNASGNITWMTEDGLPISEVRAVYMSDGDE